MEGHPPYMMKWARVTSSHVIGLYFFDGAVSGVPYLEILKSYVIPEPSDRGIVEQMCFQRVGAIT